MNADLLARRIHEVLAAKTGVAFSYLYGSALTSDSPRDVDVAVFLDYDYHTMLLRSGRLHFDFILPVEMNLEQALSTPVDVQVLNDAPLSFRAGVASRGRVVLDRDSAARCEFECRARCEYFDFRPRRLEYLAAVGIA